VLFNPAAADPLPRAHERSASHWSSVCGCFRPDMVSPFHRRTALAGRCAVRPSTIADLHPGTAHRQRLDQRQQPAVTATVTHRGRE
jgi:hypothetical protein